MREQTENDIAYFKIQKPYWMSFSSQIWKRAHYLCLLIMAQLLSCDTEYGLPVVFHSHTDDIPCEKLSLYSMILQAMQRVLTSTCQQEKEAKMGVIWETVEVKLDPAQY